jgi:GH18 family chitinase
MCQSSRSRSVNYAFAYIDPSSYEVVTMDTSTPTSSFLDTANLKSIKPDLTVFVSIGGWSDVPYALSRWLSTLTPL